MSPVPPDSGTFVGFDRGQLDFVERFLLDPLKTQITALQTALDQHRSDVHAQLENLRAEIKGSRTDVRPPTWIASLNGLSVRSMVFVVALVASIAVVMALAWRGNDEALVAIGDRAVDAATKSLPTIPSSD